MAYRVQNRNTRSRLLGMDRLSRRPPRHIFDVTSPTNSYLLNVTLDKHLPPSTLSAEYALNQAKHPLAPMSRMPLAMPQGHHLVYFPTPISPADLESDGTDPYHSPGGGFTRRVWAGGSIDFTRDNLKIDSTPAVCIETIEKVETKGVKEDEKIFLHLLRRYMPMDMSRPGRFDVNNTNCLSERRVLAFMKTLERQDPFASALQGEGDDDQRSEMASRIIKAPWKPDALIETVITPEMLFYFSALTMNAHAIHLNAERSKRVDGHKGLLVHGPFCVVLLLNAVKSLLAQGHNSESIKFFEYRNFAPLYAGTRIQLCVGGIITERMPEYAATHRRTVWIEDEHGSLCVKATAWIGPKKGVTVEDPPTYVPPPQPAPLPDWVNAPKFKSRSEEEDTQAQSSETAGFLKHPYLIGKRPEPIVWHPPYKGAEGFFTRWPFTQKGQLRMPEKWLILLREQKKRWAMKMASFGERRYLRNYLKDEARQKQKQKEKQQNELQRGPHRKINPARQSRKSNKPERDILEPIAVDPKLAKRFTKQMAKRKP
ncbi:uncharacterized protein B0I36DRAFT_359733 [Microdochium trichocladiopsis]|uniref:MaoC-like domain-containing protein n=1 Tax=Microdochium trichocladiopsis TaxID=1682393 RepID=A0A9P8YFP6_9PEZI|nr:uncharacterized protein B0I36DRAFT_359733 [Microdochium trichocladiopsis]KAH7038136.1 hypothetical protein B0I36DRAFT_359733 [Microdochium trichocladiopsis]